MKKFCRRQRVVSALLACAFVLPASPSFALSTASEIKESRKTDAQIVSQQGVVNDPLLNAWVRRVAQSLWHYVGRKDVPYSIKIIDESDVNAFTTGGGYLYINEGTLDFVQSDDELAGVIGHETGHVERRHPVTLRQRGELLSILFSLAAILSPMTIGVGSIAQAGLVAKTARTDEFQADEYGLAMMTKAGYDPDAMVSFMRRLGEQHAGEQVDRYFADHPGVPDRVKRLNRYPQLAARSRSVEMLESQALHDELTGRYSVAEAQFTRVLAMRPDDVSALEGLAHVQIALGSPARAEQNLQHVVRVGSAVERTQALSTLALLYASRSGNTLLVPASAEQRDALLSAQRDVIAASQEITPLRKNGLAKLQTLQARLLSVSNEAVDLSPQDGGDGSATLHTLESLGRMVNAVIERSTNVLEGTGSLEAGREGGLLDDNVEIMREITELLNSGTLPLADRSLVEHISRMLADVHAADDDARSGVTHAQQALHLLDNGIERLDILLRAVVRAQVAADGKLDQNPTLHKLENEAQQDLGAAFTEAQHSAQNYNLARSRGLQTRITLLGLDAPTLRLASLQRALLLRCGNSGPDGPTRAATRLSAGEVASAAIIAADTKSTPNMVAESARREHKSVIDLIESSGGDAEALEIFLGLIYLDYTDDLPKGA